MKHTFSTLHSNIRTQASQLRLHLLMLLMLVFGLAACDSVDPGAEIADAEMAAAADVAGAVADPEGVHTLEMQANATTCTITGWFSRSLTTQTCGMSYADFDADGKQEVFTRNAYGNWMLSESPSETGVKIGYANVPFSSLAFGDFNGDREADVIYPNPYAGKWYVAYSGKGGWQVLNNSGIALKNLAFGDFNGDGRTDAFRSVPSQNRFYVSWGGTSKWKVLNNQSAPLNDLAFADVNGDGKTDVLRADPVDGRLFVSWDGRAAMTVLNSNLVKGIRTADLHFADVDLDGKVDVLYGPYVSLAGRTPWQAAPKYDAQQSVYNGDIDGDGKPDSWASPIN